MATAGGRVLVIDDDPDLRQSLKCLLNSVGLSAALFETAEAFLEFDCGDQPSCILLDVRMPGMGGLQLLKHLTRTSNHPPIIIITGHGNVPLVLQSMKAGAFDFIEKPVPHQQLLDAINCALSRDQERIEWERERQVYVQRLSELTFREREVLDHLLAGETSRVIANELSISERTLEKHRQKILVKMDVNSVADLVRLASQKQYKNDIFPNIRH